MSVGRINFAGLSSGLDTKAIVEALADARRVPIRSAARRQSLYETHRDSYSEIKSKLEALSSTANGMNLSSELLSNKATSSDEDKITVAAGGSALPGNYSIEITKLAQSQRLYSERSDITDSSAALGFGASDSFSLNGKTIEVNQDTTLSDVVGLINSADANVTAGLLLAGGKYYLQVTGDDTDPIVIDESGISSGSPLSIDNEVQENQQAVLTVDGHSVTNDDNIIDDVIPGVTLNLKEATSVGGAVTVTIVEDTDSVIEKIEGFVTSYNEVVKRMNQELVFNGVVDKTRLQGDGTLRNLQSSLSNTIGTEIAGLSGNYTSLASIGIKTSETGELEIDNTKLSEALSDDLFGVMDLFISNPGPPATDGVTKLIQDTSKTYTDFVDGHLTVRVKGLDKSIVGLQDDISELERRAQGYEEQLKAKFMSMELTMARLEQQNAQVQAMISNLTTRS